MQSGTPARPSDRQFPAQEKLSWTTPRLRRFSAGEAKGGGQGQDDGNFGLS